MSVHYKTRGLVFKKQDRLEADRVFSVFTKEYGRVEVTGRAMRKIASKLRGGIDVFCLTDIEFVQGKNKKTLTDAVILEKFGRRFNSPEKLDIAYRIGDTVDHFIKGEEKDEHVLELLIDVFGKLATGPTRQLIYFYFFWNFATLLGYAPDLLKVEPKVALLIQLITKREWEQLAVMPVEENIQTLFKEFSNQYYRYLLEHTR